MSQALVMMKNGQHGFCTVDESTWQPVSQLNNRTKVITAEEFYLEDRRFTYSTYAEPSTLIHVVHCPLLKWQCQLKFQDDRIQIRTNEENQTDDSITSNVFFKNVTIMIFPPKHKEEHQNGEEHVYITNDNRDCFRFSNIFKDGRICTGNKLTIFDHPSKTISLIEQSIGNGDLRQDNIDIIKEDGIFIIKPEQSTQALHNMCKDLTL